MMASGACADAVVTVTAGHLAAVFVTGPTVVFATAVFAIGAVAIEASA
jgi:hypothetical protein